MTDTVSIEEDESIVMCYAGVGCRVVPGLVGGESMYAGDQK